MTSIRRWVAPALGLALLTALVANTDSEQILSALLGADPALALAALVLAVASNIVCALRWRRIAQILELQGLGIGRSIGLYFQGMAINTVVPGGVVGGDAWRSYRLESISAQNDLKRATATVLVDRLGGLWGLTWISLAAGMLTLQAQLAHGSVYFSYLLLLTLAVAAPLVLLLAPFVAVLWERQYAGALRQAIAGLFKTLPQSLGGQALGIAALTLSLQSVGVDTGLVQVAFLATAVFLAAALPASLAGFGARELGLVAVFLPMHPGATESLMAGSIVFGLLTLVQGILTLAFFSIGRAWGHHEPRPPK